jgi:DNA ligase-1
MEAFAQLLDRLLLCPSRNGKIRLICDYLQTRPDPERGWMLAALTGELDFEGAKAGMIRALITKRVDPVLFELAYDYVGDLAETASLMWPAQKPQRNAAPDFQEVVVTLQTQHKNEIPAAVEGWLDRLDAQTRYALLKVVTGGLRIGVSGRLARLALAEYGRVDVQHIEEVWHAVEPPYGELLAWLDGESDRPSVADKPVFRPLMLANPLEEADRGKIDIAQYRAEWKWDGIRIQLVSINGHKRIYSRTGEDISASFPDLVAAMEFEGVLDGELLVMREGRVQSFNDLQQRLNRKHVTKAMMRDAPAFVRLYDLLIDGADDLRELGFDARRARLEDWITRHGDPGRFDVSEQFTFSNWADLRHYKDEPQPQADDGVYVEGLMLKRYDSPYIAGRPKGYWYKWKKTPPTIDCVLMYAQRGHGKRSSFYSDFTFGCWRADGQGSYEIVPVGKAYFGFTDNELKNLDKWIRANTIGKYGPVREVAKALVLEIAFDSVHESTRHKSGLAMRFPRIARIRWDKTADEADYVQALTSMVRA